MAEDDTTPEGAEPKAGWKPTAEAKRKATTLRVVAAVLWAVAIGLEAFGIFWVLRPPLDELAAAQGFPQWRFYLLIGIIVVIGALSIIGSRLWMRANRHDPASRKEPLRFFFQNQLGFIIAIVAFLPIILLIFLNKDMNGVQKGVAGGIGIVVALAAILLGIDFKPLSSEQVDVESQIVRGLIGEDLVWWSAGGGVFHVCEDVQDLANVTTEVSSGTSAEAHQAGKERLTLELESELNQCGRPVPDNVDDIVAWLRGAQEAPAA